MIVWLLDREYQEVSERCVCLWKSFFSFSIIEYYDITSVSVTEVVSYNTTHSRVTFSINILQVRILVSVIYVL